MVITVPRYFSDSIGLDEPFDSWAQYFALMKKNKKLWAQWVKKYGKPPGKPLKKGGRIVNYGMG